MMSRWECVSLNKGISKLFSRKLNVKDKHFHVSNIRVNHKTCKPLQQALFYNKSVVFDCGFVHHSHEVTVNKRFKKITRFWIFILLPRN